MALSAAFETKAIPRGELWSRQVYNVSWVTAPPKNGDIVHLADGLVGVVNQLSFYPLTGWVTVRLVGEYDVITAAGQTYTDGCQVWWDTDNLNAVSSIPTNGYPLGTYRAVTAEPSSNASTSRIRVALNGVVSLQLAANALTFTGSTGGNTINVPDNLADALSIMITGSTDLIAFTTTNGAELITITPATTVTGLITSNGGITLSGAVDLTFSGTTGQPEIVVPDNVADALSVKDAGGGADIFSICTTNSAESFIMNVPIRFKVTTTPVAAAGSTVADAGQLPRSNICHITSDGATKGVKLATGVMGDLVMVVNDSSTACELYAASGGTVNGLSADASVVVPASKGVLCQCTAADTWIVFDLPAKASAS